MTEAKDQDQNKKTLSLARPRLELKKTAESGQVRQSFPHGRTKTVTVEVKKTRKIVPAVTAKASDAKEEAPPAPEVATPVVVEAPAKRGAAPRTLTAEEKAARGRALEEAKRAEEIARAQAEAEAAEAKRRADAGLPPEPVAPAEPAPPVVEAKPAEPKHAEADGQG
jgi:translation initiation factor IF-2